MSVGRTPFMTGLPIEKGPAVKHIEKAFIDFMLDRGFVVRKEGTLLGLDLEVDLHVRSLDAYLRDEKENDRLGTQPEPIDLGDSLDAIWQTLA